MQPSTRSGAASGVVLAVEDDALGAVVPVAAAAALVATPPTGEADSPSVASATAESPTASATTPGAGPAVSPVPPAAVESTNSKGERVVTVNWPGHGNFAITVANPSQVPVGMTGKFAKRYKNLSIAQQTARNVVLAVRNFKVGHLKTAKKKMSDAESIALKADMTVLAGLVSPYIPRESGNARDIQNWNAVEDLQSDLKAAMGDVVLEAFPEPSAARDILLKGIGLHKRHKHFEQLSEKDLAYPGPKNSDDGKKKAGSKKRKAEGEEQDDDDDNEDEEPINAGPTIKRISFKTPVAKAAAKKSTSRRAAVKAPAIKAPAADTLSRDSDTDDEDAVSGDEVQVAQSAEEDSPLPVAMSALQVAEDSPTDVDMTDADITAVYNPRDHTMSEATTAASNSATDINAATPQSAVTPPVALESADVPPAVPLESADAPPAVALGSAVAPAAPAANLPARAIDIQAFWTAAANRFADPANVPLEDALELFMQHIDLNGTPGEHSFDITSRLIVNFTPADWLQLLTLWRERQYTA